MNIYESAEDYLEQILMLLEKKGHARSTKGYAIARKIYDRHLALTKYLIQIGVPEDIAKEDACKIEHDLSEESFAAICRQIK